MTATWDDVAAALACDIRTLARKRKRPDAPKIPDVPMWLEWKANREAAKAPKPTPPPLAQDADLPGACDYDALVKAGKISYETAKEREQVIGIAIANSAKRLETDKARGALVTREDAEKGVSLAREEILRLVETTIGTALAKHYPTSPADARALLINEILADLEDA